MSKWKFNSVQIYNNFTITFKQLDEFTLLHIVVSEVMDEEFSLLTYLSETVHHLIRSGRFASDLGGRHLGEFPRFPADSPRCNC